MLWEAGQDRVVREGRERLAELHIAVSDAIVAANVGAGVWTAKGGYRPPSYLGGDNPKPRNDLKKLVAAMGDAVKRDREFNA